MFVTLEDFFNNYRIKNQQQPNETVLNKGLFRLKREIRELKSVLDILLGQKIEEWTHDRIYEKDEYIKHNDLIYKSLIYTNYNNAPFREDTVHWQIVTLESLGTEGKGKFKYKEFIATENQTVFTVPFNMDGQPMVFVDGVLLDSSRFTKTSNIDIELKEPASLNDLVIISSGATFQTPSVIAKETFYIENTSSRSFTCEFNIYSPSVFVDGLLLPYETYSWIGKTLTISNEIDLSVSKYLVIANGNVLGEELYSKDTIDALLSEKIGLGNNYDKTQIDDLLDEKVNTTTFEDAIAENDLKKANKSTTLAGYGISDAYLKTEVDEKLSEKFNIVDFTPEHILEKLLLIDGANSGLDADTLDGIQSTSFIRNDIRSSKQNNFSIFTNKPNTLELKNNIQFDVESETPSIVVSTWSDTDNEYKNSEVYTEGNTSHIMIIKEGYFKGAWNPTLDITFGVSDWSLYNWTVSVTPTLTGYEHDYNKDFSSGNTPYPGFDNELTWDNNQSEYHYGYVDGKIVKLESIHRNGQSTIAIPARYHLIGVLKTFSTYQQINQP